jgi:hypothetical protein
VTTVFDQLALDLGDDDGLRDVGLLGAERRLEALDGVDLAEAPPAPTCECAPHGLHVADTDFGTVCWLCGRPA